MKLLVTFTCLLLSANSLIGQDAIKEVSFEEVLNCMSDTNQFFTELKKEIDYPLICTKRQASELVTLNITYQSQVLEIKSNAINPYFKEESELMYRILESQLSNCPAFTTKFFIHFDFEPWSYPNAIDKKTNLGRIYNHNKFVERGYGRPVFK